MVYLRLFTQASRRDHAACTGCDLCQLVCPVWRVMRDPELTPHGRCMALQMGVAPETLVHAAETCTLCGACEPACPENIDLVSQVIALRGGKLPSSPAPFPRIRRTGFRQAGKVSLLADEALLSNPALLKKVLRLAGKSSIELAIDHGIDIVSALERGKGVAPSRLSHFIESLLGNDVVVVADGLLFHKLLQWMPERHVHPLGEALLSNPAIKQRLSPSDFYVIQALSYHADHARLVSLYDGLRRETGCAINLDLHRFALPLGDCNPDELEQAAWALQGMKTGRYVVESAVDLLKLRQLNVVSAVHLAELADD